MASCGGCCGSSVKFEGLSSDYKRRLWTVIALNAGMFIVETAGGHLAGSKALQADALDFLGDALTYGITLAAIGATAAIRAKAALFKGFTLFAMGLWVFGSTAYHVIVLDVPRAELMSAIGFLALCANVSSVLLLMKYKDGDANVRSVWLCSRNDAIGNVAVMVAAGAVWLTASKWPDLIVAALMAGLFLSSAFQILRQPLAELRAPVGVAAE
ncbi:cation transporter [Bradyrhizobium sp. CCBAU 53415]|uniref:cation transporter n=1 Tax=Bradyrhizobium sp. CCBAU 53415 TaxID=1325119 RepID=UPI0023054A98|nr:cation transporter [Bradyrhizobium sp. CCBAU 53415]MDA9469011.1 cation transporter [Bradyrhizobium sp. CCBAU 53415]